MIQDLAEVHSLLSNVRDTIYTSWGFFAQVLLKEALVENPNYFLANKLFL